jgi:hypothetical protein
MTLKDWADLQKDDLIVEVPDAEVFSELVSVAERELLDAGSVRSPEGRLGHSHNAVLAIAAAALSRTGYRVRSGSRSYHVRLVESLEFTLALPDAAIKELQDYRRKRSQSIYERSGVISETEADGAVKAAGRLLSHLRQRISQDLR